MTLIHTIGHSTRTLDEFADLLRHYNIRCLVDIRTIPRSRHNPQFNTDTVAPFLVDRDITYLHMKELGGLRRSNHDSPNMGWRNRSFRGFADYMQTTEFEIALERLIEMGNAMGTAIMCAEAVPWRCHRSLIGDALLVRGVEVMDIYSLKSAKPHVLTEMAHLSDGRITYPG
jgi:uncharacterized protein (DUF488 family)